MYRHEGDNIIPLADLFPENEEMEKIFAREIVHYNEDIWIVGRGLKKFSTRNYTLEDHSHNFENSNSTSSTSGLTIKDGKVHYCLDRKGLVSYDLESRTSTFYKPNFPLENFENEKDLANKFYPLGYDKDSTYWYSSLTGILSLKDGIPQYFFPPERNAYGIKQATLDVKEGKIWGITWKMGLVSFDIDEESWEFHLYNPKKAPTWKFQNLTGIYDVGTHLIFGCPEGLGYFEKDTRDFGLIHEKYSDVTRFGDFHAIIPDNKGRIWFCSRGKGLLMYSSGRNQFRRTPLKGHVVDAYYDKNRGVLISLIASGEIVCMKENVEITSYRPGFDKGIYFTNITPYKSGFLIGASNQAIYFDTITSKLQEIKEVRSNYAKAGYYHSVCADANQNIITAGQEGAIYVYNESRGKPIIIDENDGNHIIPKSYSSKQFDMDENGFSWFLTENQIIAYNPSHDELLYSPFILDHETKPTAADRKKMVVAEDKIIFGDYINDIDFIEKKALQNSQASTLNNSIKDWPKVQIREFAYDGEDQLFIASNAGLGVLNLKNGSAQLFGKKIGLDNISRVIPVDSKSLYIAKGKNLMYLDTNDLQFGEYVQPHIVDVQIDEEPNRSFYAFAQPFEIGPDDHLVNFKMIWPDYDVNDKRSFKIKMGDAETAPSYTRFPFVRIGSIQPGRHNISYSVSSRLSNRWTHPTEPLKIKVVPYFYQTLWFYLLILAAVVFFMWFWLWRRARMLKKEQKRIIEFNRKLAETEMKALRAQMNPHFLFNVLNGIKLKVQKKEHAKAIEIITDFSKLIRSVLQNSARPKITLAEELEALNLYVAIEKRRFRNEFNYELNIEEGLELESIFIPPLLIQPYVENAIWHGILHKTEGVGKIMIDIARNGKVVEIRITDNGIGRQKAMELKSLSGTKSKSMGMQITKDRMDLNNQYLEDKFEVVITDLFDEKGKASGTEVRLRIY